MLKYTTDEAAEHCNRQCVDQTAAHSFSTPCVH